MSSVMTRYELLYIVSSTYTDEETTAIETKVGALITKVGATAESTKRLGKFRLAYPINHQRHGHYVMVLFTAEPQMVAKLEENLRITPEVLRHLILRADEAGSDQKFELIQFVEVNVDTKDDRPRRREKTEGKDEVKSEEIKAGVAALAEKPVAASEEKISTEELDKKIETALSEDVKDV